MKHAYIKSLFGSPENTGKSNKMRFLSLIQLLGFPIFTVTIPVLEPIKNKGTLHCLVAEKIQGKTKIIKFIELQISQSHTNQISIISY
jgi:hypothetical protein